MITRVEISGFKTFTDFAVDLAPLSVIAGANASGKSNFLDALRVIQGLARPQTLANALQDRGPFRDIFTKYGKQLYANKVRFAVELFLTHLARPEKAEGSRFRYEIEIRYLAEERECVITHEQLSSIPAENDHWANKYDYLAFGRKLHHAKSAIVYLGAFAEEKSVAGSTAFEEFSHPHPSSTLLANTSPGESAVVAAVRHALLNIHYIELADRNNFDNFNSPSKPKGLILKELIELSRQHPEDIHHLSTRVRQVAPNVKNIALEVDDFNRLSVIAENEEGSRFISPSLSEGTLRAIAMASLLFSRAPQRTYLFEEPETGIDPRVLKNMLALMALIATDLGSDVETDRQIICTTHSTQLLDLIVNTKAIKHATAYLTTSVKVPTKIDNQTFLSETSRINEIVPDITAPVAESRMERATLAQAKRYITSGRVNSLEDA